MRLKIVVAALAFFAVTLFSGCTDTRVCEDVNGTICAQNQGCIGYWVNASDTEHCCNGICEDADQNAACFNAQDCGETAYEYYCYDGNVHARATVPYCSNPGKPWARCTSTVREGLTDACGTNEICVQGEPECQPLIENPACIDLNGFICDENFVCQGTLLPAKDTNTCCSEECVDPYSVA